MYIEEYKQLLVFFTVSIVFCLLLVFLNYLLAPRNPTLEKSSSYECGFEPFGDARTKFDIHFYLVAILFIIFDLEVILIFPWCATTYFMTFQKLWVLLMFLTILVIGFLYEWRKGALLWK
jgi:NADH-quinone oxidoreductase subunit A